MKLDLQQVINGVELEKQAYTSLLGLASKAAPWLGRTAAAAKNFNWSSLPNWAFGIDSGLNLLRGAGEMVGIGGAKQPAAVEQAAEHAMAPAQKGMPTHMYDGSGNISAVNPAMLQRPPTEQQMASHVNNANNAVMAQSRGIDQAQAWRAQDTSRPVKKQGSHLCKEAASPLAALAFASQNRASNLLLDGLGVPASNQNAVQQPPAALPAPTPITSKDQELAKLLEDPEVQKRLHELLKG